jgi:HNH endonuclease
MTFWWVNHRQTFKEEIGGGYIWSPTKNKDGSRNQTYLNLAAVKTGDIIFSYAVGEIMAVGIVECEYAERERPEAFGNSGEQWDKKGWLVQVRWTVLEKPFSPRDYLRSIVPLLPDKYSPIQHNGHGNQKCYLASLSENLGNLLLSISQIHNSDVSDLIEDAEQSILEDIAEGQIKKQAIPETEQEQLIKARRGQGLFRFNLERIEKGCRLTGVNDKRFLIASHIKPWRVSDNSEKLDGNNGLLLSPHIDRLFDRGWVSFSDVGEVLISSVQIRLLMETWGLDPAKNAGSFNERQRLYLYYHRSKILRLPRVERGQV